jgi:two-component system sensor histidine kinase BarA
MDLSMPVMNGFDSTEKIRELERVLHDSKSHPAYIIGLSAHSNESYKIKCFEVGMDSFSNIFLCS